MRITCDNCEDGVVWASHHGGNDPNVSAEECTDCGGLGTVKVYCYGCDGEACIAYVWNGKHHYWCKPCYKDSRS